MNEALLAPRERLHTLPDGLPEKTLGYWVAAWMIDNLTQPNGPKAGNAFQPTPGQINFLLHFYEVDENGRFLYRHGVRRLAKGSGKSPFAAALALAELLGPVRLDDFDDDALGGVIGKPVSMPLVHVVATSERQTANTMRMVRAFCNKKTKLAAKYSLDPGKTYIDTPKAGRLEQVTSSAHTLEGAEVSFQVADETEHWTPGLGGPELMATMRQNASKSLGSRVVETSNAWIPGQQTVAESTFDSWCDQEDGLTRGDMKILYDARIAPANTSLTNDPKKGEISLREGLSFVYEDCPWVDLKTIEEQIWSPEYPESRSRRFFLNRPNAAEHSWCPLDAWVLLSDKKRKVEDGEDIVMFFDGSKSNDHTALVGCCMSDGHIFKIGHWRPLRSTKNVDVAAVDAGVRLAFERWHVIAFWADVREWESFVRVAWPEDYGKDLICHAVKGGMSASPIAWDMRSHAYQFAEAAETARTEIDQKAFTHDGDSALGEHVSNCRENEYRGLISVKKESPKSQRKIDLAVCMIGARMLYRQVKKSPEWEKLSKGPGKWEILI